MDFLEGQESTYLTELFKLAREISEINNTSNRNRTLTMRKCLDLYRKKFLYTKLKLDDMHINKGRRPLDDGFFFI